MEYIDGKAVIEQYSISVGELVKAILDGLPAYNAVTGKRVIDQDMMIACPKYETEEQAAKAVDYVDNMLAATRLSLGMPPFRDYSHSGAGYIDAVVRKDRIQGFLKDCKSYKFPEGYDRPQEPCVFPLRYDTFHREYADAVHLKMHGENETVIGLYQKLIGAMRLPVAAVEERFRKASSATGFDIRRVPLTPGQDFMGSPMEKALDRPISLYDLLCKLERAKHKPKFPLSEEFISKQVRAGGLHVYEPPQDRWGYWYTPFGKGAKEIEVLFAAAELGGWTDVAALSALFVDMAEVEANAELNKVLKPAAFDTNPQAPAQAASLVGTMADTLTRAKNLLPTLRGKDKRHVEAWIYREEQGCTVEDLAAHLRRSKRTAEAHLTGAKNLLKQGG